MRKKFLIPYHLSLITYHLKNGKSIRSKIEKTGKQNID